MMTRIRYRSTSKKALGISTRKRRYRRKSPYQPIQGPQAVVKLEVEESDSIRFEDQITFLISINSIAIKVEPSASIPTPAPAVSG